MSFDGAACQPLDQGAMDAPAPPRRNAALTRQRILAAAQDAFARTGYSHTGIREIAAAAGVSSTLLLRYFGSKAGLFEAALAEAIEVGNLLARPLPEMARTLAATLRAEPRATQPMLMMAMASGDPEAAQIAARVFAQRSVAPMAEAIGGPDAALRSLELAMLAIGYVFFARHLPLDPLPPAQANALDAWFTRSVLAVVGTDGGG